MRLRDCPATVTGERTSTKWPRPLGVGRPGESGSGSQETCLPPVDSEGREDVGSSKAEDHPGIGWSAERQIRGGRTAGGRPASAGRLPGHGGERPVAAGSRVRGPDRGPPPAAPGHVAHRRGRGRPDRGAGRGRGQRPGRRPRAPGWPARPASPPTRPVSARSCKPGRHRPCWSPTRWGWVSIPTARPAGSSATRLVR